MMWYRYATALLLLCRFALAEPTEFSASPPPSKPTELPPKLSLFFQMLRESISGAFENVTNPHLHPIDTASGQGNSLAQQADTLARQTNTLAHQTNTLARQTGAITDQTERLAQQTDTLVRQTDTLTDQTGTLTDQISTLANLTSRLVDLVDGLRVLPGKEQQVGVEPPAVCRPEWTRLLRRCFQIPPEKATWFRAQQRCRELHPAAQLASIHSEDENKLIHQLIQQRDALLRIDDISQSWDTYQSMAFIWFG